MGQDEELEALREHCDVVSTQNREVNILLIYSWVASWIDLPIKMNLLETPSTESTELTTSEGRMTTSLGDQFARLKLPVLVLDPLPSARPPADTEQFYLRIKIM